MRSPDITAGRQHKPRHCRRRVCLVGSLGLNSTQRAAAARSSSSHIDICRRSAGVITNSPMQRAGQTAHQKQIGS